MDLHKHIAEISDELMPVLSAASEPGPEREPLEPVPVPRFDVGLASMIDHTLLRADATEEQVQKLCAEARNYRFASVCVNPTNVGLCSALLRGSCVKVCTVIGFPLGATTPAAKAAEARDAIASGASEVDMMINVGALKSGNYDPVS